MNLISCSNCGIVLDKNKLNFPCEIYNGDEYDLKLCKWDEDVDEFVAIIDCPICDASILENS